MAVYRGGQRTGDGGGGGDVTTAQLNAALALKADQTEVDAIGTPIYRDGVDGMVDATLARRKSIRIDESGNEYVVEPHYNPATEAMGSWSDYTNSNYEGVHAGNPYVRGAVGHFYYNNNHHSFYESSAAAPFVDWNAVSSETALGANTVFLGEFDSEQNALNAIGTYDNTKTYYAYYNRTVRVLDGSTYTPPISPSTNYVWSRIGADESRRISHLEDQTLQRHVFDRADQIITGNGTATFTFDVRTIREFLTDDSAFASISMVFKFQASAALSPGQILFTLSHGTTNLYNQVANLNSAAERTMTKHVVITSLSADELTFTVTTSAITAAGATVTISGVELGITNGFEQSEQQILDTLGLTADNVDHILVDAEFIGTHIDFTRPDGSTLEVPIGLPLHKQLEIPETTLERTTSNVTRDFPFSLDGLDHFLEDNADGYAELTLKLDVTEVSGSANLRMQIREGSNALRTVDISGDNPSSQTLTATFTQFSDGNTDHNVIVRIVARGGAGTWRVSGFLDVTSRFTRAPRLTFDNVFPADAIANDTHIFDDAATGLTGYQDTSANALTTAVPWDVARYNGTNWVRVLLQTVVMSNDGVVNSITFANNTLTIGRSVGADLTVNLSMLEEGVPLLFNPQISDFTIQNGATDTRSFDVSHLNRFLSDKRASAYVKLSYGFERPSGVVGGRLRVRVRDGSSGTLLSEEDTLQVQDTLVNVEHAFSITDLSNDTITIAFEARASGIDQPWTVRNVSFTIASIYDAGIVNHDSLPTPADYPVDHTLLVDHELYRRAAATAANTFSGIIGEESHQNLRGVYASEGEWTSNPNNTILWLAADNIGRVLFSIDRARYRTAKGSNEADGDQLVLAVTVGSTTNNITVTIRAAGARDYVHHGVDYLIFDGTQASSVLYAAANQGQSFNLTMTRAGSNFITHAAALAHWIKYPIRAVPPTAGELGGTPSEGQRLTYTANRRMEWDDVIVPFANTKLLGTWGKATTIANGDYVPEADRVTIADIDHGTVNRNADIASIPIGRALSFQQSENPGDAFARFRIDGAAVDVTTPANAIRYTGTWLWRDESYFSANANVSIYLIDHDVRIADEWMSDADGLFNPVMIYQETGGYRTVASGTMNWLHLEAGFRFSDFRWLIFAYRSGDGPDSPIDKSKQRQKHLCLVSDFLKTTGTGSSITSDWAAQLHTRTRQAAIQYYPAREDGSGFGITYQNMDNETGIYLHEIYGVR